MMSGSPKVRLILLTRFASSQSDGLNLARANFKSPLRGKDKRCLRFLKARHSGAGSAHKSAHHDSTLHGTISNDLSCLTTFCCTMSRLSIRAEYFPGGKPTSLIYLANVK